MTLRSDTRLSTYSSTPSLRSLLPPPAFSSASDPDIVHSHLDFQMNSRSSSPPSYKTSQKQAAMASRNTTTTASRGNGVYTSQAARNSNSSFSSSAAEADLRQWSGALERMQDARLEKQRYVMSHHKSDEVSKLALGAKVERALARRMVGQDASFSRKKPASSLESEKRSLEVKAN